jgi:hypothetical protein
MSDFNLYVRLPRFRSASCSSSFTLVQNSVEFDPTYGSLARTALYDSKADRTISLVFVNGVGVGGAPPLPIGGEIRLALSVDAARSVDDLLPADGECLESNV